MGRCYNEFECYASGGVFTEYCEIPPGSSLLVRGVCCVHQVLAGQTSKASLSYLSSSDWPSSGAGSSLSQYTVIPATDTCFIR